MSELPLTSDEISKLRNLVCEHTPQDDQPNCYCCGGISHYYKCAKCTYMIEYECPNHEGDVYCSRCS